MSTGAYTVLDGIRALRGSARRSRHHWGALADEIGRHLGSDALVESPQLVSTQAITINAPVEAVWPWIAQMGYGGGAGFYSYDALEWLFGARRSREIHVDVSVPAVGDEVPFYPGMPLIVGHVDAPHALTFWQLSSRGKALDPTGPRPDDYVVWSWAFVLGEWSPLQTRLVTRMRVSYAPRWKWAPYTRFALSPAHWIMGRRGLIGIRDRAEMSFDTQVLPSSPTRSSQSTHSTPVRSRCASMAVPALVDRRRRRAGRRGRRRAAGPSPAL